MVNYLTYTEEFSLKMSGSFTRGKKTDAEWPKLNRFNPEGRCQIASSLSKTDSESGPGGDSLRGSSLYNQTSCDALWIYWK